MVYIRLEEFNYLYLMFLPSLSIQVSTGPFAYSLIPILFSRLLTVGLHEVRTIKCLPVYYMFSSSLDEPRRDGRAYLRHHPLY
jgi:hypothetical protein